MRELDERLGLGELIDEHLCDSRQGANKKFPFADLLRQSVYSRLAGYEDLNDARRVSSDPTFRLLGSKKNWDRGAALTSLQQRLMKTGGRLVKAARYYRLLSAEGHLNRSLFGEMLERIRALPVPGG